MSSIAYTIREIKLEDNAALSKVIRDVIVEMGAPTCGTAYADKATDTMFETYQKERAIYFVLEIDGKIAGGAGISPLDNYDGTVCELQKMYFLKEARGKGLGNLMIDKCLQKAKELGFEKCYLETLPYMVDARKLYAKKGFTNIDGPLGNTGHYSCDVWMIKEL